MIKIRGEDFMLGVLWMLLISFIIGTIWGLHDIAVEHKENSFHEKPEQ